MDLARRISSARQLAGLSQAELAEKVGVSRSAVGNWECVNGTLPAAARLAGVALATQVSFDWLATGRGHPKNLPSEEVPAVDADLIDDPAERRLIRAYRACPVKVKLIVLQMAESHAPRNVA